MTQAASNTTASKPAGGLEGVVDRGAEALGLALFAREGLHGRHRVEDLADKTVGQFQRVVPTRPRLGGFASNELMQPKQIPNFRIIWSQ